MRLSITPLQIAPQKTPLQVFISIYLYKHDLFNSKQFEHEILISEH
jgi:hypothetical protein